MSSYRRWAPAGIAAVIAIVILNSGPVAGHTASIKSSVTLNGGYGYFQGKVKSPRAACREDRKVKLLEVAPGADPVLKSTTTNSTGAWAISRPYEEGTFYVRVPRRVLKTPGHKHTCKATSSRRLAPVLVVAEDTGGWLVLYYDCLEYASNPETAKPLAGGPIFVVGPDTPPMGFGSLQLFHPGTQLGFSFGDARWGGIDGKPLSKLKSITYSSYITSTARPPNLMIHVDVNGDGGDTEIITFTPPSGDVDAGEWQKWKVGRSSMLDTAAGPITLSAYKAAHPAAEIDDPGGSEEGIQLQVTPGKIEESDCPHADKVPYMDAVIVDFAGTVTTSDFEP